MLEWMFGGNGQVGEKTQELKSDDVSHYWMVGRTDALEGEDDST